MLLSFLIHLNWIAMSKSNEPNEWLRVWKTWYMEYKTF